MRRAWIFGLAFVALACGKGNSTVTDQSNTLKPQSAIAFSATAIFISVGGVMVTDAPGACNTIAQATSGANACNSSGSSFDAPVDGTSLLIGVIPAAEGKFNIIQSQSESASDGGSSINIPTGAVVTFTKSQGGKVVFSDTAVSGTVNMDSFKVGGSASGSYDVVMKSGAHLTGDFAGDDCPALDQQLAKSTSGSADRSCSFSSGGSSSCTGSCSCGGKTVSSNCSQPADGGAWTCTCTDASGTQTTCTMPSGTQGYDACSEGTSCCPYTF